MERNILGTKTVTQIGVLVNDIETAAQEYADFRGAYRDLSAIALARLC